MSPSPGPISDLSRAPTGSKMIAPGSGSEENDGSGFISDDCEHETEIQTDMQTETCTETETEIEIETIEIDANKNFKKNSLSEKKQKFALPNAYRPKTRMSVVMKGCTNDDVVLECTKIITNGKKY